MGEWNETDVGIVGCVSRHESPRPNMSHPMERRTTAVSSDLRGAMADPPAWVADAVVCQIFPDRFRRSGRVREQRGLALQPWGTPPDGVGFQGGDLYGVIEGLDHLQQLGITCLYLTRS